ncbi:MAG: hypothetical protein LBQ33_05855, partial [Oscillospiraceae bacterium]|nr:hypothetical protein [Oscillospiraceae bacterium]
LPVVSALGARTLQIYVWQTVVFNLGGRLGLFAWLYAALPLPAMVLLGAVLTLLLAWKPLGVPVKRLTEVKIPKILRKKA